MSMNRKKRCGFSLLMIFAVIIFLFPQNCLFASGRVFIENIHLEKNPYRMNITLSGKSTYRVLQNDKKEVLIAFKQTGISKNLKTSGNAKPFIKSISLERLPGDIVSFVVNTQSDLKNVDSKWRDADRTLTIYLNRKISKRKKAEGVSGRSPGKMKKGAGEIKEEKIRESAGPQKPVKTKYNGVFDDLLIELSDDECAGEDILTAVLKECEKKSWEEAFNILMAYLEGEPSERCLEPLDMLKAYTFFKLNEEENDTEKNLKAAEFFQDVISYYPDSPYVAYALMGLGNINLRLDNKTEAKGYFKVIRKDHRKFNGMPEVLLLLGRIYNDTERPKQAVGIFKEGVQNYPYSAVNVKTRIDLGKALFNIKNYEESIQLLLSVIKGDSKLIYKTPQLLILIGNSYYQLGKTRETREYLGKVYNLFPETELNHEYLTKIGDTYRDENDKEKALEIYRLVIEKYPGSTGFVLSTMRLADLSENQEEKEEMYQLIINDFPEHSLHNVAMLRLAELYNRMERYLESIATIKKLLEIGTRALKKDALDIMQEATISLFSNYLKEESYPKVLSHYETDKKMLSRFKDPRLFLLVGNAYFEGYLYTQAIDNYAKSFELYKKEKKPSELIMKMAISMQEVGLNDEALNTLNAFVRDYPKDSKIANAYTRRGELLHGKNDFNNAIKSYREAYKRSDNNEEKVRILIAEAKVHKTLENYKIVSLLFEKAITILASGSYDDFNTIFLIHRNLGENYMKLKSYVKASEAFSMALKFSDKEKDNADIYFMLGDSYQKSDAVGKAVKAYEDTIATGEAFWSKMARERLNEIKVEKKLQKT